eukprot:32664-Chlamydomonas_euryale.AAC.4
MAAAASSRSYSIVFTTTAVATRSARHGFAASALLVPYFVLPRLARVGLLEAVSTLQLRLLLASHVLHRLPDILAIAAQSARCGFAARGVLVDCLVLRRLARVCLFEAVQRAELVAQQRLELRVHLCVGICGDAAVVVERPELLQPVEASTAVVAQRVLLKRLVHLRVELGLQAIAPKAKEALEAVVVAGVGVLPCEPYKLVVHVVVEVVAHEVAPEAEERVHLLAVPGAVLRALLDSALVELDILDLLEAVVLQQRVAGVVLHVLVQAGAEAAAG